MLFKFLANRGDRPRYNLAPFLESPKVDYLLFYKGVCYGSKETQAIAKQTRFSTEPKIHQFTLKRINKRSDLSGVFPISSSKIRTLYAAQNTNQRKIVFSRFLGIQFESNDKFYKLEYSLTHTLNFGYWINQESFLQILQVSFNINPIATILKPNEGDKLAIEAACFLLHQIKSYDSKIIDGKLYQHQDLTALSAENRLLWLTMLLEEWQFLANGKRL